MAKSEMLIAAQNYGTETIYSKGNTRLLAN